MEMSIFGRKKNVLRQYSAILAQSQLSVKGKTNSHLFLEINQGRSSFGMNDFKSLTKLSSQKTIVNQR